MYLHQRIRSVGEYAQTNVQTDVHSASPHRLIQMLLEGFLTHINVARGAMEHGDMALKGEQVSRAIMILGGLEESLDCERGGELAQNLANLYRYIRSRLLFASSNNDQTLLNEVVVLMIDIKGAWDAIPDDLRFRNGQ
jgi:flagellar protein FliS